MAPLAALAERTNAAILGLMHLAKSTQRPAIYRAVGSIAFAAAARIVLAVAADPERDDRRIMAAIKSNLAAAPPALAYTLSDGKLVWAAEPVSQVDVDTLLSGPVLDRQERRAADEWLRELLAAGPALVRDIQAAARAAGLVWRTIERAKTRLGVKAALLGYGPAGRWQWRLPETDSGPDHTSETDTFCAVSVSETATNKIGLFDQRPTLPLELSVSGDLSVSEQESTETGGGRRERVRF
jgi:putative DNA primase/helicase